ncbi:hypothetical protein [Clostridium sp.]|uniref:hypothetical protein n=1 Tax=Clostridium sp. TaxID=1506 RepID=UPI003F2C2726
MVYIKGIGLSDRGNKVNEDIFNITEKAAWVLDGATGLTGSNISGFKSDASWYVDKWNEYLKKNINDNKSLKEIIRFGISIIKEEYRAFSGFDSLQDVEYPCAAISLIRLVDENKIEYFVLGDCTLLFKNDIEELEIYDRKLEQLEEKIIDKIICEKNKNSISLLDAKKLCLEDIKNTRLLKNKVNGYWILELDEEAVNYALTGTVDISKDLSVCIMSDGFSQYYDTLNISKNSKEFMELLKEKPIEELLEELRRVQENDGECNKYPRLKKGDDSTIVYLKFK